MVRALPLLEPKNPSIMLPAKNPKIAPDKPLKKKPTTAPNHLIIFYFQFRQR
jgi:hypothetical protein